MSISDRFMQQVFHISSFLVHNPYMDFFGFLSIYALYRMAFCVIFLSGDSHKDRSEKNGT